MIVHHILMSLEVILTIGFVITLLTVAVRLLIVHPILMFLEVSLTIGFVITLPTVKAVRLMIVHPTILMSLEATLMIGFEITLLTVKAVHPIPMFLGVSLPIGFVIRVMQFFVIAQASSAT
jgi:hypothetical protein